jgi:hypothetical protein
VLDCRLALDVPNEVSPVIRSRRPPGQLEGHLAVDCDHVDPGCYGNPPSHSSPGGGGLIICRSSSLPQSGCLRL